MSQWWWCHAKKITCIFFLGPYNADFTVCPSESFKAHQHGKPHQPLWANFTPSMPSNHGKKKFKKNPGNTCYSCWILLVTQGITSDLTSKSMRLHISQQGAHGIYMQSWPYLQMILCECKCSSASMIWAAHCRTLSSNLWPQPSTCTWGQEYHVTLTSNTMTTGF